MSIQTVASLLDGLEIDVEDGLLVNDVLVVIKTVNMDDGEPGITVTGTAAINWLDRIGMLRAALVMEELQLLQPDYDDD